MKKIIIIFSFLAFFVLLVAAIFLFYKPDNNLVLGQDVENVNESKVENENVLTEIKDKNKEEEKSEIDEKDKTPEEISIKVPFLSQAPFQKWDALHEDACEEASLIMLKYFSDDKKMISKELAEKEIQDMVAFEKKNKYGISITLNELNEVARKYYNLKTGRVEKNITIDDIKKELSDGKPVIVGAAGKVLPNPNFKNGGPNYHMLVVVGYDKKGFITNDPGTRLGEGFKYTFEDLYKSIHDWDPKNILNGGKSYLVLD